MKSAITIHVAEGIEDLHDCSEEIWQTYVDRLMDFNILGEKTLLVGMYLH